MSSVAGKLVLTINVVIPIFCILELIFLELYMRHLDSVHFALNDLQRDKAILRRYYYNLN